MERKAAAKTAVQRVQARIKERLASDDRPRGSKRTQAGLADRLGITPPSMSELLNGKATERGLLHYLDAISDYLGVPPSLLVAKSHSAIAELRKLEPKMLAHFRRQPASVQAGIVAVFEHFDGLLPEEREARIWWSKIRRIKRAEDRARLEAVLDDVLQSQRSGPANSGAPAAPASSDTKQPSNRPKTGSRGTVE